MRPFLLLSLAALVSGCVQASEPWSPERVLHLLRDEGPSSWEESREPSMAPSFDGMGPSYPVLLIHQHHVPSARQQEEARRNPVVCLRMDGSPLALAPPTSARDMAACMGPAADPPTGRAFADRAEFVARGARGLAVMMSTCSGGAVMLTPAEPGFQVAAPGHTFVVRLHENGTFRVDGRWIEPGTALKVGYVLHEGDARDEQRVRVVFDAPGVWLLSRMGGYGEGLGPDVPPRPDMGTGLAAEVPVSPASLADPLRALFAASPGRVLGVSGLRVVHDGARMTELTARVETDHRSVTWYGAGRIGGRMLLLGAEAPLDEARPTTPREAALGLAELRWEALRDGVPGMVDARLDPTQAWTTAGAPPVGVPGALPGERCGPGCVRVLQDGEWRRLLAPTPAEAAGAASLRVVAEGREAWWHIP